jgi:hypothetical protein
MMPVTHRGGAAEADVKDRKVMESKNESPDSNNEPRNSCTGNRQVDGLAGYCSSFTGFTQHKIPRYSSRQPSILEGTYYKKKETD